MISTATPEATIALKPGMPVRITDEAADSHFKQEGQIVSCAATAGVPACSIRFPNVTLAVWFETRQVTILRTA